MTTWSGPSGRPATCSAPIRGRVRTGAFAYNLKTETIRQLSNYIEPHAWLHDNIVVIQEGCHVISRTYAIYLE